MTETHYNSDVMATLKPFPNTPFRDRPKFKEAADDNYNVGVKGFKDID